MTTNNNNNNKNINTYRRISKLEIGQAALVQAQTNLTSNVADLTNIVREQGKISTHHYVTLSEQISQVAKPNIGLFVSIAGVGVTLLGLTITLLGAIGATALAPLYIITNSNYHTIDKLSTNLKEHITSDSHPVAKAKLEALREEMSRIERKLTLDIKYSDDILYWKSQFENLKLETDSLRLQLK